MSIAEMEAATDLFMLARLSLRPAFVLVPPPIFSLRLLTSFRRLQGFKQRFCPPALTLPYILQFPGSNFEVLDDSFLLRHTFGFDFHPTRYPLTISGLFCREILTLGYFLQLA